MKAPLALFVMAALVASPSRRAEPRESAKTPIHDTAQARAFFVTQWGPTAFNAGGAPYGYEDCGPAVSLMLLGAHGHALMPRPEDAPRAIDRMRDVERDEDTTISSPTYSPLLVHGLEALGADVRRIAPTPAAIRGALRDGSVIALAGDPRRAWGQAASDGGYYLVRYSDCTRNEFDHWVAIVGIDDSDALLLNDPLSVSGPMTITDTQLMQYVTDSKLGAVAFAVQ